MRYLLTGLTVAALLAAYAGYGCVADMNGGWHPASRDDPAESNIETEDNGTTDREIPDYRSHSDVIEDDSEQDADQADDSAPLPESASAPVNFCRSFDDCADGEVCDFSLGTCLARDTFRKSEPGLLSFRPPAGAAGDVVVIDATLLHTTLFEAEFKTTATIGGVQFAGGHGNLGVDENRMVGVVPANARGKVGVVFGSDGGTRTFATEFGSTSTGTLKCDSTTPGRGEPGWAPDITGPWAAGYVDTAGNSARVFYPAECGSVRRPPSKGRYPLVFILHGNGALHINYEYLGQLLATWGFVVVMPKTIAANDWSTIAAGQIKQTVDAFRGRGDLGTVHRVLSGVGTTADFLMIGHSRGCFRIQEFLQEYPAMKSFIKGSVFLAPVSFDFKVPGMFMVIGADRDGQSGQVDIDAAFNRQPAPKFKVWIKGGNHGNFTDHKVYYSADGMPSISRHEQLTIVQNFVIPFAQRVFATDEPFAEWLDAPPESPICTVTVGD